MECLFQVLTDMLMQFSSVFVFWSFASPDIMQRGDRRDERVIADENRPSYLSYRNL